MIEAWRLHDDADAVQLHRQQLEAHPDHPPLVEVFGDLGQERLVGRQLLDREPAVGRSDHREDVDAHHPVLARRQADGARDLGRGLAAEELEVVGGDRAVARPDLERRPVAGAFERLGIDAAERGPEVRHGVDAWDRALQHGERPGGDVARLPPPWR